MMEDEGNLSFALRTESTRASKRSFFFGKFMFQELCQACQQT